MDPAVSRKVGTPAEVLPAVGALVRFLACVRPLVIRQVGAAAETLPALQALVGLLSRVHPDVVDDLGAGAEALPTQRALVGLLARVRPLVGDEGGLLVEVLPAVGATVGLLPRVDPLVGDELGAGAEALPAFGALVGLLPCVRPLMGDEGGFLVEALATDGTLVWLLGHVGLLVPHQLRRVREPRLADRALVGLLSGVDPLVDDEVSSLVETGPTERALVGLLHRLHFRRAKAFAGTFPRVDVPGNPFLGGAFPGTPAALLKAFGHLSGMVFGVTFGILVQLGALETLPCCSFQGQPTTNRRFGMVGLERFLLLFLFLHLLVPCGDRKQVNVRTVSPPSPNLETTKALPPLWPSAARELLGICKGKSGPSYHLWWTCKKAKKTTKLWSRIHV